VVFDQTISFSLPDKGFEPGFIFSGVSIGETSQLSQTRRYCEKSGAGPRYLKRITAGIWLPD